MKASFALLLAVCTISSAQAGAYSKKLWDKNELTVCFAKGEPEKRKSYSHQLKIIDWKEKDKAKVKEWTNSEYTKERTGIYFTGWKSCEETAQPDVIIFFNKNSRFFGNLDGIAAGYGPVPKVDGYPHARSYAAISKSGMDKTTVLHEFGHVVGLAHEHNHPDSIKEGYGCGANKPIVENTFFSYEPYDKRSIMSYCNFGIGRIGDTEADLLKRMYPEDISARDLPPSLY